jgi:uroporphyrin-III C-methyltransferase
MTSQPKHSINNFAPEPHTVSGKVILAGAGCGDPELITVKAARYLSMAEVVLTDRLVNEAIISKYVSPDAVIVYVGKQHNNPASVSQKQINELLIQYAMQGKLVVRLKGGDVAFFSNVLDELTVLKQYAIPYEIIPGITAASGASAYAGIPLTARGYATAVRLLTLYAPETIAESYWKELAEISDTLVLYMSSDTLPVIVKKLLQYHIDPDKRMAVMEQATTPSQQITIADLSDYLVQADQISFSSPTIVIIGKVVSLHQQFSWFSSDEQNSDSFKPLQQNIPPINLSEHVG